MLNSDTMNSIYFYINFVIFTSNKYEATQYKICYYNFSRCEKIIFNVRINTLTLQLN